MPYELQDHTADIAVEATAPTLGDVFAAVAEGLSAAMADDVPAGVGDRFEIEERAESREALLFDFLDRLIYERDVREVLPVDYDATVDRSEDEWRVIASARGIPLSEIVAREVKAVTYSQMELSQSEEEWYAYVVFDV